MRHVEYLSLPGVNSHALKALNVSPAQCWQQYFSPQARQQSQPSASIRVGLLAHCLTLTPEMFDDDFYIFEDSRRTKIGRERYDALAACGKTVVSPSDLETAQAIQESLLSRTGVARLLHAPLREHLAIKERGADLLPLKARFDAYHPDKKCIVELKTIRSLDLIDTSLTKYHYLLSAAFYMTVADAEDFVFVFVETSEPFTVVTYEMTHKQRQIGTLELQESLRRFDECWKTNDWPDTSPVDDDPLFLPILEKKAPISWQTIAL